MLILRRTGKPAAYVSRPEGCKTFRRRRRGVLARRWDGTTLRSHVRACKEADVRLHEPVQRARAQLHSIRRAAALVAHASTEGRTHLPV